MNCENYNECGSQAFFRVKLVNGEPDEYYCPECMGNIVQDEPEIIYEIYNMKF